MISYPAGPARIGYKKTNFFRFTQFIRDIR